jgi:hypothetical protein
VVREGVGAGGRNEPSMYAHMNNKRKKNEKKRKNLKMSISKRFVVIQMNQCSLGRILSFHKKVECVFRQK